MIIERIQDLPDVAQRSFWAEKLTMDPSSFWRAEKRGELRRLSSNGRNAIYSREEILRWLKIDVPNP